jgi:hypothetical protein
MPDTWIYQNSRAQQLAEVGLDAAGLARAVRKAVDGPLAHPAATEPTPIARGV